MRRRLLESLIIGVLVVPIAVNDSRSDEETPTIAHLAFRDHVVTISSSAGGPLYTVRTHSGALVSEKLSDEQMLAAHPELHQRIRAGDASDDDGSFIWAGSDQPRVIEAPESEDELE